ncbi:MAG TPA: class I SAM-dependent methyltransferase [Chitinophagaceae bacterium]|jgi:ubiquinone/menaquinone biosynthesis C-methylase UbiE|nr:class I SAM-dependent methyltransferase [Chitinophagaceae bacterium]
MKDNFSQQASLYAKYRPAYPPELFDFILGPIESKQSAWDCATGNGQTAKELAKHFNKVCATDISQKQLDNAGQARNIVYSLQPAEGTNFKDDQFDLVTVSQALHWFDFEKFYAEVKRVTRHGGWIAAWMYGLLSISPEIDELIHHYHFTTLGDHWDPERKYVDDNYAGIPFPFEPIKTPVFAIRYEWTIEELEGYFGTWSALQKFIAANGFSPVADLMKKIRPYWSKTLGEITEKRNVVFPLHLRMGAVSK